MTHIKLVETLNEIKGIHALLQQNLKSNLDPEELTTQGFVTCDYSLEVLELMNNRYPSVIAVDKYRVVGYCLVLTKENSGIHPLILDLVSKFPNYSYGGRSLDTLNYCLVGQICVAATHRGLGLVQQLYAKYRDSYSKEYDYLITDIDVQNPRSLMAHKKTGFQVVGKLEYDASSWDLVLWDWNTDTL